MGEWTLISITAIARVALAAAAAAAVVLGIVWCSTSIAAGLGGEWGYKCEQGDLKESEDGAKRFHRRVGRNLGKYKEKRCEEMI